VSCHGNPLWTPVAVCDGNHHFLYERGTTIPSLFNASEAGLLFVPVASACIPRGAGFSGGWMASAYGVAGTALLNTAFEEWEGYSVSGSYCYWHYQMVGCCYANCNPWCTYGYFYWACDGYNYDVLNGPAVLDPASSPPDLLTYLSLAPDDCYDYTPFSPPPPPPSPSP